MAAGAIKFWLTQKRWSALIRGRLDDSTRGGRPYQGRGEIIEVDGKTFWGKSIGVRSDDGEPVTYADLLARWARTSHTSLRQALGVQRSRIFVREMNRPDADPQRILLWMLRGEAGANGLFRSSNLLPRSIEFLIA